MKLKDILEGICKRKDGESDEEFISRCGNALTNDRDKVLYFPKTWDKEDDDSGEEDNDVDEDGMPGGAFVGLTSPSGYINGAPDPKKVKKLSKKLHKQREEDVVNDNDIDRKDMLLNKFLKSIIKAKEEGNVLESHILNCPKCGHSWESEEGGQDETICHKCGHNLYHVKEGDINKPSPKLRPEPHPTRHETEHPPYEKDAMKVKGKYSAPTKK